MFGVRAHLVTRAGVTVDDVPYRDDETGDTVRRVLGIFPGDGMHQARWGISKVLRGGADSAEGDAKDREPMYNLHTRGPVGFGGRPEWDVSRRISRKGLRMQLESARKALADGKTTRRSAQVFRVPPPNAAGPSAMEQALVELYEARREANSQAGARPQGNGTILDSDMDILLELLDDPAWLKNKRTATDLSEQRVRTAWYSYQQTLIEVGGAILARACDAGVPDERKTRVRRLLIAPAGVHGESDDTCRMTANRTPEGGNEDIRNAMEGAARRIAWFCGHQRRVMLVRSAVSDWRDRQRVIDHDGGRGGPYLAGARVEDAEGVAVFEDNVADEDVGKVLLENTAGYGTNLDIVMTGRLPDAPYGKTRSTYEVKVPANAVPGFCILTTRKGDFTSTIRPGDGLSEDNGRLMMKVFNAENGNAAETVSYSEVCKDQTGRYWWVGDPSMSLEQKLIPFQGRAGQTRVAIGMNAARAALGPGNPVVVQMVGDDGSTPEGVPTHQLRVAFVKADHRTHEDCVVMSQSAADRLRLRKTRQIVLRENTQDNPAQVWRGPANEVEQAAAAAQIGIGIEQLRTLGDDGVVIEGTKLRQGHLLQVWVEETLRENGTTHQRWHAERYRGAGHPTVTLVEGHRRGEDDGPTQGAVRILLEERLRGRTGLKLQSRIGTKGMVVVRPDAEMPQEAIYGSDGRIIRSRAVEVAFESGTNDGRASLADQWAVRAGHLVQSRAQRMLNAVHAISTALGEATPEMTVGEAIRNHSNAGRRDGAEQALETIANARQAPDGHDKAMLDVLHIDEVLPRSGDAPSMAEILSTRETRTSRPGTCWHGRFRQNASPPVWQGRGGDHRRTRAAAQKHRERGHRSAEGGARLRRNRTRRRGVGVLARSRSIQQWARICRSVCHRDDGHLPH